SKDIFPENDEFDVVVKGDAKITPLGIDVGTCDSPEAQFHSDVQVTLAGASAQSPAGFVSPPPEPPVLSSPGSGSVLLSSSPGSVLLPSSPPEPVPSTTRLALVCKLNTLVFEL